MDTTSLPGSSGAIAPPPPTYEDRSTGLVIFGIIQIILGALSALMVPLALLGLVLSQKTTGNAMPIGALFMSIATYGALAAVLITLGIGSINARRWARALTLVLSWIWLIAGVVMTVFLTAFLPTGFMQGVRQASAMNPNAPPISTGAMAVILTFIIVFLAVFFVVIPLAFALFYRTRNVEETCRHKDPVERWTDRCPLPVLAASLIFAAASAYFAMMSFTTPLMPFFGRYLTGIAGGIACLVLAGVDAFLAYSLFRLQWVGWCTAVATMALRVVSVFITYRHGNLFQAYSKMGWKDSQLQLMSMNPAFRSGMVLYSTVAFMVGWFGYLLWLRRYFPSSPEPGPAVPETSYLPPGA